MSREMFDCLDKEAVINVDGLSIDVKIVDVKVSYGKKRYKVEPLAGSGSTWVESVTLKEVSNA